MSQVPWVKLRLIGPFLSIQDNLLYSAHSLIKIPQVPQDLPPLNSHVASFMWSAQTAPAIQADAKLCNYDSI